MQDLCPNSTSNTRTKEIFTADDAHTVLRYKPPVFNEDGNISPISSQGTWEELNADFHSISGDEYGLLGRNPHSDTDLRLF